MQQLDADVAPEFVQRLKAALRVPVAKGYGGSDDAAVHLRGTSDCGLDGVMRDAGGHIADLRLPRIQAAPAVSVPT